MRGSKCRCLKSAVCRVPLSHFFGRCGTASKWLVKVESELGIPLLVKLLCIRDFSASYVAVFKSGSIQVNLVACKHNESSNLENSFNTDGNRCGGVMLKQFRPFTFYE